MRSRAVLVPVVLLALVGSREAAAQGYSLSGFMTPVPASAYPTEWQGRTSLASLTLFNDAPEPATAVVVARLTRNGVEVGATDPATRMYPSGGSFHQTPLIANWGGLRLTGIVRESVEKTGRLPDGSYSVCVEFTNVQTVSGVPMFASPICTPFYVSFPKPPSLVYPPERSTVTVASPVFQWTPTIGPGGLQPPYQFRLVEILPGQTPLQAIEANRPLLETLTLSSTLPYPPSAPLLQENRRYAWRVQAVLNNPLAPPVGTTLTNLRASAAAAASGMILPYGANEGRSQVFTFNWLPAGAAAAASSPDRLGSIGATPAPGSAGHGMAGDRSTSRYSRGGEAPRAQEPGSQNFADRLIRVLSAKWHRPGVGAPRKPQDAPSEPMGPTPDPAEHASASIATPDSLAQATDMPIPVDTSIPAQEPTGIGPDWAKLHGTASVSGETYSRDGSGAPTRPDQNARVVTAFNVGLMDDRLRVPVDALVSGDQVSFRQNINQIALTPRFSWAGVTAGNFAPQYSPYTLADATLLGAGFELTPRQWRIGLVNGRSRRAIAPSTDGLVEPQFKRNVLAGRVGFGDPVANIVELSVLRAKDDESSLGDLDTTVSVPPEGNTVYALRLQRVLPRRHVRIELETAVSRYDRDVRATTGSLDGTALGLKVFRETSLANLAAKVEYLNGGFMTLGNSGITGDRLDLGLAARVQIVPGKLQVDGSAGWRNDAVTDVGTPEASRRTLTLNGTWQPMPRFGVDVQSSFFLHESGPDTLVSQNTNRILTLAPRVAFRIAGFENTLTTSATIQSMDNSVEEAFGVFDTKSLTLFGNWSSALSSSWSLSFGGNYTKTDYETAITELSTFGPGLRWAAPKGNLNALVELQVSKSRFGNNGSDTDLIPRLETRWEFTRGQAVVFRGNVRRYRYAGSAIPEFTERLATMEYVTSL